MIISPWWICSQSTQWSTFTHIDVWRYPENPLKLLYNSQFQQPISNVPIVVTFHHSIPRTKFVIAVIKCGLGTLSVIIFSQASNQQALLNRQHSQSVTAKRDSVVSRQDMLSARLPVIQTFAAPGIRGRLSYWQDGGRDSGNWERAWCKQGFLN